METVEEYLKLADIDYNSAKVLLDSDIIISCVQHCVQAVEKCLKAFTLKYSTISDRNIMRSHDCYAIYSHCLNFGLNAFDNDIVDVISAFDGYYKTRYPSGSHIIITNEIAVESLKTAELIISELKSVLLPCVSVSEDDAGI